MMNTVTKSVSGADTSNPISSIVGAVGGTVSSLISGAAGKVNGLVGSVTGAVTSTFKSLGGNVTNVASAVNAPTAAITAVKGDLSKASGALNGQLMSKLGSLGSMASEIKTPTVATGTFNNTALVAKAGTLVGDASIPAPVFTVAPKEPEEPNAQQLTLEEAGRKVQEETAKTKELLLYRQKISENYEEGKIDKAAYLRLLKLWAEKADARLKSQQQAEAEYAALLKGESASETAT
jgi:hypothetical protein